MNEVWTSDYAFEMLKKHETVINGSDDANEATTRMRTIDTILFDVLGWDKLKVETERHVRAEGYADYCFKIGGNISLVLEAKKNDQIFLLPNRKFNEKPFGFGLLVAECRPAYDAMVQAAGYATNLGSRYVAISNGHQWLLALCYVPNQPMDERLVYIFESINAIKERFQLFWDCFSYSAIHSNHPAINLSESRKKPAPAKFSTTIPGYPIPIDRNHLKNEISFFLSVAWDELNSNDNSTAFLETCYILPDSSECAFTVAKEIIEKRNKQDEQLTGEALSTLKVPQLIKDYSIEKPILVMGDIGHGKSTFLRYLRLIKAQKELTNYIQIEIDFLDIPDNREDVPSFINREITSQLCDRYKIDTTADKFVRAALKTEIDRFKKTPRGKLYPVDCLEYKRHELEYIEGIQKNYYEYLKYVFNHIKSSYNKSIAIFFDNLDKRLPGIQEEAFLRSSAMARDWNALIFVCLRPSTYYSSKRSGVLDSIAPKIISITSPDVKKMLNKRFEYAIAMAKGEIPSMTPAGRGFSLECVSAVQFFECCKESLRNGELVNLFRSVSNGNARSLLSYTKKIITNSHLDTRKIIEAESTYIIPLHEAERSLLYGDYQHYDPKGAVFINFFDLRHSDRIEHFCKLLLLDFLNSSYCIESQHGYCRLKDMIDYSAQLGYTVDYTKEMTLELIRFKYCRTDTWEDNLSNEDTLIGISSLGRYHLNVLVKKFTYIDAIVIDTPIIDDAVRSKIRDVTLITERLERAELFLAYLDDCSNHLQDEKAKSVWQKVFHEIRNDIDAIQTRIKKSSFYS